MLIDTHCHLDFPEFDADRDAVIRRAKDNQVNYIINVGSSLAGSQAAVELSRQYDCVYASVGLHPHEADTFNKEIEVKLTGLAKNKRVVAIGEIGLDYYKNYSLKENQRPLFSALLNLAKDLRLPVIIHSRQAQEETLEILKRAMPIKVVVHCFSGDEYFLKACLALGFFVSFTCNITYKKAISLRGLVKIAPLEKIFLETDAPFLAPEGFRGRRNEPMHAKTLAAEIARIREIDIEEVAKVTTDNARSFFNLT